MSKKDNPTIGPEAIQALRALQKKKDSGEAIDPESNKALNALAVANKIMNSINSGSQVDPAYLKALIFEMEKDLSKPEVIQKKITKKKKLKIKGRD